MYAGDLPLVPHPTYVYATCMADELIAQSHGTMGPIKTSLTEHMFMRHVWLMN